MTLSSITITHAGYKFEALNEHEGLRFEDVGNVSLITRYNKLTFIVDISNIRTLMGATQKLIFESEEKFENDQNFIDLIRNLKKTLDDQVYTLDDIFNIKSYNLQRQKRKTDEQRLETDLNNFVYFTNELNKKLRSAFFNFNDSIHIQNATNLILLKDSIINQVNNEIELVRELTKSLLMMQQREKLSELFVSFKEFKDSLQNIAKLLRDDEKLPYSQINEYFYNLKVSQRVRDGNLELSVNIPFIDIINRKLFKIHEIPSYYDGKLMITDVKWHYMAVSDKDMVMFMDSKKCLNGVKHKIYFCETQSHIEIMEKNASCLVNAYKFNRIDPKLCRSIGAEMSKLAFIKLSNGEFFYYAPKVNETTLEITCNGSVNFEVLKNHTGILTLDQGCRAKSEIFELVSTMSFNHEIKNIYLEIGYAESDLDDTFKSINKRLADNSKAYDDLNIFREDIQDTDKEIQTDIVYSAESGMDLVVIFAITFVVIFLVIVFRSIFQDCCSSEKSYYRKKKENNIVKIIKTENSNPC